MIDWDAVETVFLDMDGTLLDLNFDNHFWCEFVPQRYAEMKKITLTEAKRELVPRFKEMEGRIEWYCLDHWSRELELDIAGLKSEISGLIAVLPHVVEFLEKVRMRGKRLVLVTNAHRDSLGLKMEKTALNRFFDRIICAHDFGIPKENVSFWHRLNEVEPFQPEMTVMVDDSMAVLRSAAQYGIRNCIAILKPDSKQPSRSVDEFPAICDFRELNG
ncbi:MAG: GMP/IMP nucleotidase [Gammaproteobacteria bacterium]|nr:MAG: GMP/IMP nucleotidase [Gammaproteobacteria bacterium]